MGILINLLIFVVILGLVYWVISIVPLPPPFRLVVQVIFAIIAIIMLLGFVGWVPGYHIGGYRHF